MVMHYLHLRAIFGENRCTQFRVIVVADPQTHKHTHKPNKQTNPKTRPITIQCAAILSAQCNQANGMNVHVHVSLLLETVSRRAVPDKRLHLNVVRLLPAPNRWSICQWKATAEPLPAATSQTDNCSMSLSHCKQRYSKCPYLKRR